MGRVLQSPVLWAAVAALVWLAGLWVAFGLPAADDELPRAWPVPATAYWATAFWVAASAQMLWLRPAGWDRRNGWLRLAAFTWVLAVLMHLVHVAVAFDLFYRWSWGRAVRNTEEVAGFGEGLYVNFAFAIVWAADAAWLALLPTSYARRPRWVGWAVHGFLAFITFNATVVFGSPPVRWAGAAWFAVLAFDLGRRLWRTNRPGARPADSVGGSEPRRGGGQ